MSKRPPKERGQVATLPAPPKLKPKMKENEKSTDETSSPKQLFNLKLLCLNAGLKRQHKAIVELKKKHEDADVIAVIEARDTRTHPDKEKVLKDFGTNWKCESAPIKRKGSDTILCFYDTAKVGTDTQFTAQKEERFLTMTFTINKCKAHLMIVHLPNRNASADAKTKSYEKIKESWDKSRVNGPAIVFGDFNIGPDEIDTKLGNGYVAFVDGQLLTNAEKQPRCIDNAYASHHCELVSIYGEKMGNLDHKVFAVCYSCYDHDISKEPSGTSENEKFKLKLLCINGKKKRVAHIIEEIYSQHKDADIIAIVEAHDTKKEPDSGNILKTLGENWKVENATIQEEVTDTILCFFNETCFSKSPTFVVNKKGGRFLAMKFYKDGCEANLMIVHLPNRNASTEDKETSDKEVKMFWAKIRMKNPAIVFGDFNKEPGEIAQQLKNGYVAFVEDQLLTNAEKQPRSIDNAYANRRCELVSMYGEKMGTLDHKVFAVGYRCYDKDIEP